MRFSARGRRRLLLGDCFWVWKRLRGNHARRSSILWGHRGLPPGDVKAETKLLKTCHYFGATATSEMKGGKRPRRGTKLMFEQDVVGRASGLAA